MHDYDYIKSILLKRYKLSPEEFRLKFFSLKKEPSANWRDFAYEIKVYFKQWIDGLEIDNVEELSELIVVNQKFTCRNKDAFCRGIVSNKKDRRISKQIRYLRNGTKGLQ